MEEYKEIVTGDIEIYHMFFDNLKQTIEKHKNGNIPLEKIGERNL